MQLQIEAYHEINGERTDLGGFPYSAGITQRVVKDFEYSGIEKEQDIDEENQSGESYITYAYDSNAHLFQFEAQVTEIDFLQQLKYHSHVHLTIEGDKRRLLRKKDVTIEQVTNVVYIATLYAVDSESITILKGDEL